MGRWVKAGVLGGLLLPMVALLYLAMDVWLVVRVPDTIDWLRATTAVRRAYRPGDVVVFSPPWAQGGAPFLTGLDVVTSEAVDWYEVGKHARVWVVASPGGTPPLLPESYRELQRKEHGAMEVYLYGTPDPGRLTYDFLARLGDAKVTRILPKRREECRNFRDQRWFCGAQHPWQFVGRRMRDVAGAVREVIWAHPLDKGAPIEIRYPAVPMGKRLVVHYGLTQRATEAAAGAPVTFVVRVGDHVTLERALQPGEVGWFEHVVDVAPRRGIAEDVVFTVSTPDFKLREFTFRADMWE